MSAKGDSFPKFGSGYKPFYSCQNYMGTLASFCDPTMGYTVTGGCPCTNENAMATFTGCLNATGVWTDNVIDGVIFMCLDNFNVTATRQNFTDAFEYYKENAVSTSEIPNFNISIPIDVPVLVNRTVALTYKAAYEQFIGNYQNSLFYGTGVLGYWALVILIAILFNWLQMIFPRFFKHTTPFTNWIRKNIILPAVHKKRAEYKPLFRVLDLLVPGRFETIILFVFLGITIGCLAANIKVVPNDPIFLSKSKSIGRQIAVRAGIIASTNMPLVILFAGRNNFLLWITGWNFATCILYHRWTARVAFSLVVVHGIGYSIAFSSYYRLYMKDTYVIWGMLATVAGGFIMVLGLMVLRRTRYEFFLITHIILSALFIAGAWIHVDDLGYVWFYYATSAVWIFDRVVRICRLIYFGGPEAQLTLYSNDTLKVVVPKPKYWKSVPGGHGFVHFLRLSCFWQSHPFCMVETEENKGFITFYCKIKGGITHGLYKHIVNQPGRTAKVRVSVEGPYGTPSKARYYDTALCIAGGSGIPGIYSEAYDLAKRQGSQIVKLIWVIRDLQAVSCFQKELEILKGMNVKPVIYITLPKTEMSKAESLDNEKKKDYSDLNDTASYDESIKDSLSHVEFRCGRPDLSDLVKSEVEESNGSICFVCCSHPKMVDEMRHCVSNNLHPTKRVEFFQQLELWS